MVFSLDGKRMDETSHVMVGAILDTTNDENRFNAMKQLLDIGEKIINEPDYVVGANEFTYASAGSVCCLPIHNASMYDGYDFPILYSKNGNVQYSPASVTKIMTIAAGLPYVDSMLEKITYESADVEAGSGNFFSDGDIITIYDILYAIMMPSSNTSARAFARHIGRKLLDDSSATHEECLQAFYAEMNRVATAIGCTNSHFESPSGNTTANKTTTNDLVRIVIHACSFPAMNNVWNKKAYTIHVLGSNPRAIDLTFSVTTNPIINTDYHVFGGKTGSAGQSQAGVTPYRGLAVIAEPKN